MTTDEEQRYWALEQQRLIDAAADAGRRSYEAWTRLIEEHRDV
jgi:hypothetical protein